MKILSIFSGGLDSTALIAVLAAAGHQLRSISINYGQRHRREIDHAVQVAARLHIPHEIVDLSNLGAILTGSSQTDTALDVPSGHYTDQSMRITVVPNRNMIFLAVATGRALSLGFEAVAFGAHRGDHAIYPDCRAEFVAAMQNALQCCDYSSIKLITPFLNYSKAEIVQAGAAAGAPFELTYSCYRGGEKHCGTCGTCVERKEAFALANVADPTNYQS
ncbi:7-cyano-7-deazaguanine synthase QueC [bacterium]|nr:7-cyano-7-deazaguanine synthase QueC [bacterium]